MPKISISYSAGKVDGLCEPTMRNMLLVASSVFVIIVSTNPIN